MKFGAYAINSDPLTSVDLFDRIGRAAEDFGYDTLWIADHVIMPVELQQEHPYTGATQFTAASMENAYEPIPTLAYLAAITSRVRLLTSVLVLPYRHPVVTAKMLSTVDQLARGRLVLGAGVGWLAEEFDVLDADYANRGAVTDEMIEILRTLWTAERPEYHGKFYDFNPLRFQPKPVQQPHPPIWIGGHSRSAIRRAARLGDGWHATRQPIDTMRGLIAQLSEQCDRIGRDPATLTLSMKANARFDQPATLPADLAGSPAQIAEQIAALGSLGIELIILDIRPHTSIDQQVEAYQRFAEEVAPLVPGA